MGKMLITDEQERNLAKLNSEFTQDQIEKAKDIANSVVNGDFQSIYKYNEIAGHVVSDMHSNILDTTKATSLDGQAAGIGKVIETAKSLDVSKYDFNRNPSFFERIIPFLNRTREKFVARFDSVNDQITKYLSVIDESEVAIKASMGVIQQKGEDTIRKYNDFSVLIAGGLLKLKMLSEEIVQLEAQIEANGNNDPLKAQELANLKNFYDSFDKSVTDTIAMQAITLNDIPKLQIMLKTSTDLVQSFQRIKTQTIPLWRSQMETNLLVGQQERSVELVNDANDFTEKLLLDQSKRMKTAAIAIAKANSRPMISVDTIKTIQKDTLETIEGVYNAYLDGAKERQKFVAEVEKSSEEFKKRIASNKVHLIK